MALFRRWRLAGVHDPGAEVDRFWLWWADTHDEVASALDDGDRPRLQSLLEGPVRAVHPHLAWHAGPGIRSRYRLALSGARHPALRVVTERWRRAGPPDTTDWEFHPARPAEPSAFEVAFPVDGVTLNPALAVVAVQADERRFRLDLTVHHPAFAELDELARSQVANVLVGWALGEDDTDRWVGQITATDVLPLDGVPVVLLASVAARATQWWAGEHWVRLEGMFGEARLVAAVRYPLHRVDHPLLDEHVAVRLPYGNALPDGQPTEIALEDLLAAQRAISRRLERHAVLVGVQTASGERLLHFYADSCSAPLAAVRELLGGYIAGEATVQARFDPGWEAVEHLRVASAS
jgi:hypothetical protein